MTKNRGAGFGVGVSGVDRSTVDVYEERAQAYVDRGLRVNPATAAFAEAVDGMRLDLGCGPGHMTAALGSPVVAADAAWAMVTRVTATALRVQADLEVLPFRRFALGGIWASKCLQHVPAERLPLSLRDQHRSMAVGGRLELVVFEGDDTIRSQDGPLAGRMFWRWPRDRLVDVVAGAGFSNVTLDTAPTSEGWTELHVIATRARSLGDTVGPGMRLLVCGLNPSLFAADAGIGFARPGNRFWPALAAAGIECGRNPLALLRDHGIGMTDIVKRATVAASELAKDEFVEGMARVERLCAWLQPQAVYFVGLQGWRAAVDRKATAGWQERALGGVPVYVAPSTSGLNAGTSVATHTAHLRAALGSS